MNVENSFDHYEVSNRLSKVRTNAGLTQAQLAESLGISEQAVKNYEKAASQKASSESTDRTKAIAGMKIETLFNIASKLNVSADYLLGLSETRTPDVSVKEMVEKTGLSEDIVLRLIAWNNIDNSTATVDATSPEYLKQISEDLNWVSKKDAFSDLVIEFTNCILSAYLEDPRTITRWHQGYMYSLYTWYSALKSNSEHQIYSKADEIEKEIQNFGLVTLTAEESAELRLSNIMTFLKDRFSDKAKQLIFTEIDGNSSSKDET